MCQVNAPRLAELPVHPSEAEVRATIAACPDIPAWAIRLHLAMTTHPARPGEGG